MQHMRNHMVLMIDAGAFDQALIGARILLSEVEIASKGIMRLFSHLTAAQVLQETRLLVEAGFFSEEDAMVVFDIAKKMLPESFSAQNPNVEEIESSAFFHNVKASARQLTTKEKIGIFVISTAAIGVTTYLIHSMVSDQSDKNFFDAIMETALPTFKDHHLTELFDLEFSKAQDSLQEKLTAFVDAYQGEAEDFKVPNWDELQSFDVDVVPGRFSGFSAKIVKKLDPQFVRDNVGIEKIRNAAQEWLQGALDNELGVPYSYGSEFKPLVVAARWSALTKFTTGVVLGGFWHFFKDQLLSGRSKVATLRNLPSKFKVGAIYAGNVAMYSFLGQTLYQGMVTYGTGKLICTAAMTAAQAFYDQQGAGAALQAFASYFPNARFFSSFLSLFGVYFGAGAIGIGVVSLFKGFIVARAKKYQAQEKFMNTWVPVVLKAAVWPLALAFWEVPKYFWKDMTRPLTQVNVVTPSQVISDDRIRYGALTRSTVGTRNILDDFSDDEEEEEEEDSFEEQVQMPQDPPSGRISRFWSAVKEYYFRPPESELVDILEEIYGQAALKGSSNTALRFTLPA